jgi:hypothetical protein
VEFEFWFRIFIYGHLLALFRGNKMESVKNYLIRAIYQAERNGKIIDEDYECDAINLIEAAMRFIEEKQPYLIKSIRSIRYHTAEDHEEVLEYKCRENTYEWNTR